MSDYPNNPSYPPPSYPQQPQAPPKKSKTMYWVLGCLGLLVVGGLIVVALVVGLGYAGYSAVANSEAFLAAQAHVKQSAAAKAEIGDITEIAGFPSNFNIETSGSGGTATIEFDVTGTKGKGTAKYKLSLSNGKWVVSSAQLVTSSGKTVNL